MHIGTNLLCIFTYVSDNSGNQSRGEIIFSHLK